MEEDFPARNTRKLSVKQLITQANKQDGDKELRLDNSNYQPPLSDLLPSNKQLKVTKVQSPITKITPKGSDSTGVTAFEKIKERARRLSANNKSLSKSVSVSSLLPLDPQPITPIKTKRRRKSTSSSTELLTQQSPKPDIRKFLGKNMEAISEVISSAHSVLEGQNDKQVNPSNHVELASSDNEIIMKVPIQGQTGQPIDKEPSQPNTTPANKNPPQIDYDNMSNGDMIRLFMQTMTAHKEEIKAEIRKGETRLDTLENKQTEINDTITTLKFNEMQTKVKTTSLETEVTNLKTQVLNLTNVVVRQDSLLTELQSKDKFNDKCTMRANLIIKGIVESEKENCFDKVKSFFKNTLQIEKEIAIQIAHRIGKGTRRPVRVVLKSANDKGLIYKNANKLKGLKNSENRSYTIRDQLPPKATEEKIRRKDLLWENKKKLNTTAHLDMSMKKGSLMIGNNQYKRLVRAPTAKDILKASVADQLRWRKVKCTPGKLVTKEACSFLGFSVIAGKIDTVRDAYLQLREKFADARHIICSYRLPGKNFALLQDYIEDNEFKAGKVLLQLLTQAKIYNRAIFVVRYYGGEHLGPARFDAICEAARSAILHDPYNHITKTTQSPWPVDTVNTENPSTETNEAMGTDPPVELQTNGTVAIHTQAQDQQPTNQHFQPQQLPVDGQGPPGYGSQKDRQPSGPSKPLHYLHNRHTDPDEEWNNYYETQYRNKLDWSSQMAVHEGDAVQAAATELCILNNDLVKNGPA